MKSILKEKIYKFYWNKDTARNATIIFVFDENKWKLGRVDYVVMNRIYDIDDWEFIHELAVEVIKLDEENRGVKDG